jgi:hypothetical protein
MCSVLIGKAKERDGLENTFMNERIILKWFLKQCCQGRGTFIRTEQEHEYSVLKKFLNF